MGKTSIKTQWILALTGYFLWFCFILFLLVYSTVSAEDLGFKAHSDEDGIALINEELKEAKSEGFKLGRLTGYTIDYFTNTQTLEFSELASIEKDGKDYKFNFDKKEYTSPTILLDDTGTYITPFSTWDEDSYFYYHIIYEVFEDGSIRINKILQAGEDVEFKGVH